MVKDADKLAILERLRNKRITIPTKSEAVPPGGTWQQAYQLAQAEIVDLHKQIDELRNRRNGGESYYTHYVDSQRREIAAKTELNTLKTQTLSIVEQNKQAEAIVILMISEFGIDGTNSLTLTQKMGAVAKFILEKKYVGKFEEDAIEKAKKQLREACDAI